MHARFLAIVNKKKKKERLVPYNCTSNNFKQAHDIYLQYYKDKIDKILKKNENYHLEKETRRI